MTYRIGWLSPFTPASGVGTFSSAVTESFPDSFREEPLELTILHGPAETLYKSKHRQIKLRSSEDVYPFLDLFDLLIYNMGNNELHHKIIFDLMLARPGIVILHDYVYQHYLVGRLGNLGGRLHTYASLLYKYDKIGSAKTIERSRITSRSGKVRYAPWDTEYSVDHPLVELVASLGSAAVVHSAFALDRISSTFSGPVLQLNMPSDQKKELVARANEKQLRGLGGGKIHLVSFGYIQKTKCLDLVLNAIASSSLLRGSVRFTIAGYHIGDQSYLEQLREIVRESSLSQVVTFSTNLPEAELANLMDSADVFVNLRRPNTEGSSASLTEQLITGRPVVVLDSGCYAELPVDAAIKISPRASVSELRDALENLVEKPQRLRSIGEAGRRHAQRWTCGRYVDELLEFVSENKKLLYRRSRVTGYDFNRETQAHSDDVVWEQQLAEARKTVRLFDLNLLSIDPETFVNMSEEELVNHVTYVILGVFDDAEIVNSVRRYVLRDRRGEAYIKCLKLAILADGVFYKDHSATQRFVTLNATPIFDLDLWAIVSRFDPVYYFRAATLLLTGSQPADEDCASCEGDAKSLINKRIAAILDRVVVPGSEGLERFREWIDHPVSDEATDLCLVNDNLFLDVGSEHFNQAVNLVDFYPQEKEIKLVWMKGSCGFIELRLGERVTEVAFLLSQLHASSSRACVVRVRCGNESAELTTSEFSPQWLSINVATKSAVTTAATWFRISTSYAAPPPPPSGDARKLSVCICQIRILVGE